jgi:hypothetical protein
MASTAHSTGDIEIRDPLTRPDLRDQSAHPTDPIPLDSNITTAAHSGRHAVGVNTDTPGVAGTSAAGRLRADAAFTNAAPQSNRLGRMEE